MEAMPVVKENYFTSEEVDKMVYYPAKVQRPNDMPGMGGALGFETSAQADRVSMENPLSPLTGVLEDDESILKLTEGVLAVKKDMEKFFGLEMSMTNCNYMYMRAGAVNELHSDTTDLDGNPYHEEEETEYSALIYLNDSGVDFEGGDIYFPLQEKVISPKRGMVIFFKGDQHHPHGITEVTSGERRVVVLFFGRKGNVSDRTLFLDEHSGVFED
jgi:hypothetical protein